MDNLPDLPDNYKWHIKYGGMNYLKLILKKKYTFGRYQVWIKNAALFVAVDDLTSHNLGVAANRIRARKKLLNYSEEVTA